LNKAIRVAPSYKLEDAIYMQHCHIRVGGRNGSGYNAMKTRGEDELCCTLVSWQRHAANGVSYRTGLADVLQLQIYGYKQALEFRGLFLTREVRASNTVTEQSAWRRYVVVFPSSFSQILG
jgi:hypothetical protein